MHNVCPPGLDLSDDLSGAALRIPKTELCTLTHQKLKTPYQNMEATKPMPQKRLHQLPLGRIPRSIAQPPNNSLVMTMFMGLN